MLFLYVSPLLLKNICSLFLLWCVLNFGRFGSLSWICCRWHVFPQSIGRKTWFLSFGTGIRWVNLLQTLFMCTRIIHIWGGSDGVFSRVLFDFSLVYLRFGVFWPTLNSKDVFFVAFIILRTRKPLFLLSPIDSMPTVASVPAPKRPPVGTSMLYVTSGEYADTSSLIALISLDINLSPSLLANQFPQGKYHCSPFLVSITTLLRNCLGPGLE